MQSKGCFTPGLRSVCTFKAAENVPKAKMQLSERSEFCIFNSQQPVSQKKVLQAQQPGCETTPV